jgi:hypothetical protein
MARVGEAIVVATPPPLPANGGDGSASGGARGPKIGSKGQSRSRAREHVPGGSQTATGAERTSEALNREGSGDSEVDEQRNTRRGELSSPVDQNASGEHPHTPVNGASASAALVTSSGPPKAMRRLRDTSSSTSSPGLLRRAAPRAVLAIVSLLVH